MRALLGLLVFSVLLATGAPLKCDICTAQGKTCSDMKECPGNLDTCMSVFTERNAGQTALQNIAKTCATKAMCAEELAKMTTQLPGGVTLKVECSKAPPSAGSLLLALSGLLLLKILV